MRDLLVGLGLQEIITYRLTSPERERRLYPDRQPDYIKLANPIASERTVLRQSLLASVLEVVERNARLFSRQALFEIGPEFIPDKTGKDPDGLPHEKPLLVIALTGARDEPGWQPGDIGLMDFYDLKGILEALLGDLYVQGVRFAPGEPGNPAVMHPGRCAHILASDEPIGTLGELHPLLRQNFDLPPSPLLVAELELEALYHLVPERYNITPVPAFPPVLEDLALIVDEDLPAEQVEALIRQAGGTTLSAVRLFDVYRGGQVGDGKKSLAYSLTYQAPDRTLTDAQVAQLRERIVKRLEEELGAKLRG